MEHQHRKGVYHIANADQQLNVLCSKQQTAASRCQAKRVIVHTTSSKIRWSEPIGMFTKEAFPYNKIYECFMFRKRKFWWRIDGLWRSLLNFVLFSLLKWHHWNSQTCCNRLLVNWFWAWQLISGEICSFNKNRFNSEQINRACSNDIHPGKVLSHTPHFDLQENQGWQHRGHF